MSEQDDFAHRTQSERSGEGLSREPPEYRLTCDLNRKALEWIRPLLEGAGCRYSIARFLRNVPDEVRSFKTAYREAR